MSIEGGNYESHTQSNPFDIARFNSVLQEQLNGSIKEKFAQSGGSQEIGEVAVSFEEERNALSHKFCDMKMAARGECICDLGNMKFSMLNDKFKGSYIVELLQEDLKKELNIELMHILEGYDDFINQELALSDNSNMSEQDYNRMIQNIRTIVSMELKSVAQDVYKLKKEQGGTLENMQWIINDYFQKSLSKVNESVLGSAKFYLALQENIQGPLSDSHDIRKHLEDKFGSLHINKRERQIAEALVEKELVIHQKEGWLDLPDEDDTTREINSIPTDILQNDSFWTADKNRNYYRDLGLMRQDYDGDGVGLKYEINKLSNISVLNEKDRETEQEYLLAILAIELFSALPIAGTVLSVGLAAEDLWNNYDASVQRVKELFPDLDQSYTVEKGFLQYAGAFGTIVSSIIQLHGAMKSINIATITNKLQKFDVPYDMVEKTFLKVGLKIGLSYQQVLKLFNTEQTIQKEAELLGKEKRLGDSSHGLQTSFAA